MKLRCPWRLPLGLIVLFARVASAAPGDATRLEYARGAEVADCPDRSALRDAVKRRLGYDPFFPAARQAIVVEITLEQDVLLGAMRLVDEDGLIRGTRALRERREHCEELVASLALAVSIALDPSAALQPETEAEAPTEPTAPPNEPEEAPTLLTTSPVAATTAGRSRPARDRDPQPAAERSFGLGPRAQVYGAFGAAPGVVGGARGGLALHRYWFALTGELAYQLPATREVSGGARARTASWSGNLAPCYSRFSLYGCALLSVGYLTSEGDGATRNRVTSTQVALGLRLEYAPALNDRVRLLVGLDALKPLLPLTFRLQERDVWSSPWLTLAAAIGLQLEFP